MTVTEGARIEKAIRTAGSVSMIVYYIMRSTIAVPFIAPAVLFHLTDLEAAGRMAMAIALIYLIGMPLSLVLMHASSITDDIIDYRNTISVL